MKKLTTLIIAVLCSANLFASSSYEQTSKFHKQCTEDFKEYNRKRHAAYYNPMATSILGISLVESSKGIVAGKRDRVIGHLLQNYSLKKHSNYMTKILESKAISNDHKNYLVKLFNGYKEFLEETSAASLKKISAHSTPTISSPTDNLDLFKTPYLTTNTIKAWVATHYSDKETQDKVLEDILEYRQFHILATQDMEKIYSVILKI